MTIASVAAEGEGRAGIGLAKMPIPFVMRGLVDRCSLVFVIVGVDKRVTVEFVMIVLQITVIVFVVTLFRLRGKNAQQSE